ncbi:MAG: S1 RNA-binding domain-containing protein [Myxococcota bacterium]|nr:S1 RNA-binding domain-containing protein [Myxococcota bacterium]
MENEVQQDHEAAPQSAEQVNAEQAITKPATTEQAEPPPRLKVGEIVTGYIEDFIGEIALLRIEQNGTELKGYINRAELRDGEGGEIVQVGEAIEVEVVSTRSGNELSRRPIEERKIAEALRPLLESGELVEAEVIGVNKGGFELKLQGVRAFCPGSQFSLRYERDGKRHIGKSYQFKITDIQTRGGIVVSRRAVLEAERENRRERVRALKVGSTLKGRVNSLTHFGVFVELFEGVDGLVHRDEASYDRGASLDSLFKVGDEIDVKLLGVDIEKMKISLSYKQLQADPWQAFVEKHNPGDRLTGTVARVQDFGAFIAIEKGIDGLLHVSSISPSERIESAQSHFNAGDSIEVVIEEIDRRERRLRLMSVEMAEATPPSTLRIEVGEVVKVPVAEIRDFGVFVTLSARLRGLIPNSEMNTERGADHKTLFPIGTEVEAKIIEVDRKKKRVRLSRKAMEGHAAQLAFKEFQKQQDSGTVTLGDLFREKLKR